MSEGAAAVAPAPATPSGAAAATAAAAAAAAAAAVAASAANDNNSNSSNGNETAKADHDMEDDDGNNSHDDTNVVTSPLAVGSATSTPQKERHSLTLDQRRALRRWANAQLSRPSHKQCIEWFQRQYHQTISQSTVSHSLSPKYARLDGEPQLSGSRLRFGNWPEVEKLVLLWYQQMVHAGRHPTNEELAEKAKSIFSQLPRHRGEEPPEFSPGWIHRFKKRYGLLIRRQRRQSGSTGAVGGSSDNPATDVAYLVDTVPQMMSITPDTNPVAIRETIMRVLGVEPSIATCTRVRDEIARYDTDLSRQHAGVGATGASAAPGVGAPGLSSATTESQASAATAAAAVVAAAAAAAVAASAGSPGLGVHSADPQQQQQQQQQNLGSNGNGGATGPSGSAYHPHPDEDPETALQNALRQLQQDDADAAEAEAAATAAAGADVPAAGGDPAAATAGSSSTPTTATGGGGGAASSAANRAVRCPFCVNQRMLRTIKEAVDHMSTHVVV